MSRETGDPSPELDDVTNPDATVSDTAQSDADPAPATRAAARVAGRRRWRVSRHMTVWTILVPLVAVLAGALFSASSGAAQGTDLRSAASTIPDLIREETRRGEIRANEVARLQGEVDQLTEQQRYRDEEISEVLDEALALAQEAGTAAVEGPGLAVSLSDSPLRGDQIPPGLNVDDLVVHQQDVQGVVNALWRGGAEAMMIQDQRVISTSAVRCVGNTLILQGRVYSPPFVITAIGNQGQLQKALDEDPTVQVYQQYVDAVGLGYSVEHLTRIQAPAYTGSIRLEFAEPIR